MGPRKNRNIQCTQMPPTRDHGNAIWFCWKIRISSMSCISRIVYLFDVIRAATESPWYGVCVGHRITSNRETIPEIWLLQTWVIFESGLMHTLDFIMPSLRDYSADLHSFDLKHVASCPRRSSLGDRHQDRCAAAGGCRIMTRNVMSIFRHSGRKSQNSWNIDFELFKKKSNIFRFSLEKVEISRNLKIP